MNTQDLLIMLPEITALKARIFTFADLLDAARREVHASGEVIARLTEHLGRAKEALREIEADTAGVVLVDITADDKGTGRPTYSNETARKAEVRRRLALDPRVAKLNDGIAEFEQGRLNALLVQQHAVLALKKIEDQHRGCLAAAELTVAEVALLVNVAQRVP